VTNRGWFTALLLLLVGVLLAQSLALAPASRLAPLWVLVPTAVLLLVQILLDLSPRARDRLSFLQTTVVVPGVGRPPTGPEVTLANLPAGDRRTRELRVILWITWLTGLVYLVGFLLSTALFLLPFLRLEARIGWLRSLVLAAVAIGVIYVVFGVVARVPFPAGILVWR
jgi:hypothetical protein